MLSLQVDTAIVLPALSVSCSHHLYYMYGLVEVTLLHQASQLYNIGLCSGNDVVIQLEIHHYGVRTFRMIQNDKLKNFYDSKKAFYSRHQEGKKKLSEISLKSSKTMCISNPTTCSKPTNTNSLILSTKNLNFGIQFHINQSQPGKPSSELSRYAIKSQTFQKYKYINLDKHKF